MAFVTKMLFGGPVKSMSCCTSGGAPQEILPQSESRVNLMRRWSSEEQHRRILKQDMRRNSLYAQQKAERALMREHFREKYNLAKNAHDQQQVKSAPGNVRVSRDLRAVMRQDQTDSQEFSITDLLADLRKSTHSAEGPLQPGARCLVM